MANQTGSCSYAPLRKSCFIAWWAATATPSRDQSTEQSTTRSNDESKKARQAAPIFRRALEQIQHKTPIPILLPAKLPASIREQDIKLASGTVSSNGYFISLYLSALGSDVSFVAGFGGARRSLQDPLNTRAVVLPNGLRGMFAPVSCGGSCAPANLWWEHDGVMYQIQVKFERKTDEKEQERILVETAISMVSVPRQ